MDAPNSRRAKTARSTAARRRGVSFDRVRVSRRRPREAQPRVLTSQNRVSGHDRVFECETTLATAVIDASRDATRRDATP